MLTREEIIASAQEITDLIANQHRKSVNSYGPRSVESMARTETEFRADVDRALRWHVKALGYLPLDPIIIDATEPKKNPDAHL